MTMSRKTIVKLSGRKLKESHRWLGQWYQVVVILTIKKWWISKKVNELSLFSANFKFWKWTKFLVRQKWRNFLWAMKNFFFVRGTAEGNKHFSNWRQCTISETYLFTKKRKFPFSSTILRYFVIAPTSNSNRATVYGSKLQSVENLLDIICNANTPLISFLRYLI